MAILSRLNPYTTARTEHVRYCLWSLFFPTDVEADRTFDGVRVALRVMLKTSRSLLRSGKFKRPAYLFDSWKYILMTSPNGDSLIGAVLSH